MAVWAPSFPRVTCASLASASPSKFSCPISTNEEAYARFRREGIGAACSAIFIVEVHDFNMLPDGTADPALELLEGETLAQRLQRGALPLAEALAIARQVGSALEAAHAKGIVHRDLKPAKSFSASSLRQGRSGERQDPRLRNLEDSQRDRCAHARGGRRMGTPQYMAPEQALGHNDEIDWRTDIFAMGSIAFDMLAGRPAFTGNTIPEVVFQIVYKEPPAIRLLCPALPEHVGVAIQRALAKKPADRFDSAAGLVEALTGKAKTPAPAIALDETQLPGPARAQPIAENPALVGTAMMEGVPKVVPTTYRVRPRGRLPLALVGATLTMGIGIGIVVVRSRSHRATELPTPPPSHKAVSVTPTPSVDPSPKTALPAVTPEKPPPPIAKREAKAETLTQEETKALAEAELAIKEGVLRSCAPDREPARKEPAHPRRHGARKVQHARLPRGSRLPRPAPR